MARSGQAESFDIDALASHRTSGGIFLGGEPVTRLFKGETPIDRVYLGNEWISP